MISDSLRECLAVVALAVHRQENPDLTVTASDLIDICCVDRIDELDRWMRPLRPFIVTGQDYLWQYHNKPLLKDVPTTMADYRKIYKNIFNQGRDVEYKELFYSSRKLLCKLMGKDYMGLFTTYAGAIHALRISIARHSTYVCTARDRQALELVLERHQISLARDNIYSQDFNADKPNTGDGKSAQILRILDRNGGRDQPFVIVEDQVKAPQDLRQDCPAMRVIVAAYGYGLAADWQATGLQDRVEVKNPADLLYHIY